jgi:hypothetical protein
MPKKGRKGGEKGRKGREKGRKGGEKGGERGGEKGRDEEISDSLLQEKTLKKKVRKTIKLVASPKKSMAHTMCSVIYELADYPSNMIAVGVQYAMEQDISMSFKDFVIYCASSPHIVFLKIISAMVCAVPEWLPESPLRVISEMIQNRLIHSYICIPNVITSILDCELDEPDVRMMDEMFKQCQLPVRFTVDDVIYTANIKKFIRCISYHCDMDEYLTFLTTEKSDGLTTWFHPIAEANQNDHGAHLIAQWTIRLGMIYEQCPSIYPFETILRVLTTLASNNIKFKQSNTFKIGMCRVVAKYYSMHKPNKRMEIIQEIYILLDKTRLNIATNWSIYPFLSSVNEFHETGTDNYADIVNRLMHHHKKTAVFRACLLKRIQPGHKDMRHIIISMIYGKLCKII